MVGDGEVGELGEVGMWGDALAGMGLKSFDFRVLS